MIDTSAPTGLAAPIESVLRDELAHGDAMIGTIAPILRHLLANDEHSVFGDEIVASMRGMMADIARQLVEAWREASGDRDGSENGQDRIDLLIAGFSSHPGFLSHVHALALETQLARRMQERLAIDPVLSPLLQALIASNESVVAASAMALLASQVRFMQSQRRMQLPLSELPGDLLHAALQVLRGFPGDAPDNEAILAKAEQSIRANFDESRSRLGLISRLVTGMGGGATAALSVGHAGVSIFLSALAIASGQDRDMIVLATNESQIARLALALRASGLRPEAVSEQFASLHPDVSLPGNFAELGSDGAAALLARSAVYPNG